MDGLTGLTAFIDPSSVLIVAALTAAMFGTTARERPKSLAQNLPAAAFLGVLIGVIAMMQHMSTPKLIGPAMAIAVLTLLYCNALSVLLKLAFPDTTLEDSPSHFTYLGFVLVFVMGATSVLLLSFI
jgi:flagellar motor component MotA